MRLPKGAFFLLALYGCLRNQLIVISNNPVWKLPLRNCLSSKFFTASSYVALRIQRWSRSGMVCLSAKCILLVFTASSNNLGSSFEH
jgi:hypothetical protein